MTPRLILTIPQPCSESWSHMQATTQGRHCGACQQAVVDFTAFTDAEVVSFLAQPANQGRCGRFRNDQLNRSLRAQPPAPRPWTGLLTAVATSLAACSSPHPDTATQPPAPRHPASAASAPAASAGAPTMTARPDAELPHLKKVLMANIKVVKPLPPVHIPEYYGETMGTPVYMEPDSVTVAPADSTRSR